MEFEDKCCPITNIDGHIATGKQFDLDIVLLYMDFCFF